MKIQKVGNRFFLTSSVPIRAGDKYIDSLVHPKYLKKPLVMLGFLGSEEKIIQSNTGTTSPISTSRKVLI